MRLTPNNRIRRSTLVYATVFLLAVVLYFMLRPEPASPVRHTPVTNVTTETTGR